MFDYSFLIVKYIRIIYILIICLLIYIHHFVFYGNIYIFMRSFNVAVDWCTVNIHDAYMYQCNLLIQNWTTCLYA